MKKNSKLARGIVAGVVGLALLLGGGTFALWYQSESVSAGSVNSGALSFATGAQTWRHVNNGNATIADISAFKIVPGDTVSLTTAAVITAKGNDLLATLKVDSSGLTGDPQLLGALDVDFTVSGLADTTAAGDGSYEVVPADDGVTANIVVTIHFPAYKNGDTPTADRAQWWGAEAQTQAVALSTIKFDLAQHL